MGAFYNTVARSFERLCSWKQMHSTDFSTSAFMGLSLSSPRARLAALRSMERRTNEDQCLVWSSQVQSLFGTTTFFVLSPYLPCALCFLFMLIMFDKLKVISYKHPLGFALDTLQSIIWIHG